MGYLNNSTITVDAILTKKGRELLARGRDEFKITQFALADDEIDYDLYNPEHPLGTAYYGAAIENMPVVEALADETQMLKYKLVTLPKGTARIPVVRVAQNNIELNANESTIITPSTVNFGGGNRRFGYTAILSDSDVADIVATRGALNSAASVPQFIGDSEAAQSITVSGTQFEITAKELLSADQQITILFIGNETGGRASVTLTVKKVEIATTATSANTAIS
jgi:hypothetical protein|tara:strand:- start:14747 stop:15418 length:672 start_codon:yes stop_codon:yes gene_type:complete